MEGQAPIKISSYARKSSKSNPLPILSGYSFQLETEENPFPLPGESASRFPFQEVNKVALTKRKERAEFLDKFDPMKVSNDQKKSRSERVGENIPPRLRAYSSEATDSSAFSSS